MKKYLIYMLMGAGIALIYKEYERDIKCMCDKMIQKEKEMLKEGLESE